MLLLLLFFNYFLETQKMQRLFTFLRHPFRKHAYSNILKIALPKTERFQITILIFFIFLLKT